MLSSVILIVENTTILILKEIMIVLNEVKRELRINNILNKIGI